MRPNTGFTPAFKPAVMEERGKQSQEKAETTVKLAGAIKLT